MALPDTPLQTLLNICMILFLLTDGIYNILEGMNERKNKKNRNEEKRD